MKRLFISLFILLIISSYVMAPTEIPPEKFFEDINNVEIGSSTQISGNLPSNNYADGKVSGIITKNQNALEIDGDAELTSNSNQKSMGEQNIIIKDDGSLEINNAELITTSNGETGTNVQDGWINSQGYYQFQHADEISGNGYYFNNVYNVGNTQDSVILYPGSNFGIDGASEAQIDGNQFNDIGSSQFTITDGKLIHALVSSRIDDNMFTLANSQIIVRLDKGDSIDMVKAGDRYTVSLDSANGNITDYDQKVACVTISPGSRYISDQDFSVYIQPEAENFRLCTRISPSERFSSNCSSCGVIDFVENKTNMNGMFEFEEYSPETFIQDDVIESLSEDNKISGNGHIFDSLKISNDDSQEEIANTYSSWFRIREINRTRFANVYMEKPYTVRNYSTSYSPYPVKIKEDVLSQENSVRILSEDSQEKQKIIDQIKEYLST